MLDPRNGFNSDKFNYAFDYDTKKALATIKGPYFQYRKSSYKLIKEEYPFDNKKVYMGELDIDRIKEYMVYKSTK